MRPLKLSMSAFGPFATTQTIDFRKLGDSPLFLINGPTGSGKTTILDAICYALYGKTTGDEREGHQMRCDQAKADLLTEVTFEFELGDKCYRIRRVPEQKRPNLRGEGFTDQKPEAQLEERVTEGDDLLLVPRKVGDATKQIQKLTGLTADQFRQVMVLPQGKFRQLLLAESKDREAILSQLFETQFYKKVEERLKEKAKVIADEVKTLELRQSTLLETVSVETQGALEEEISVKRAQLMELEGQLDAADKESRLAQKQLNEGQKRAADFKLYEAARDALSMVLAEADGDEENKAQLARAQAAEKLRPTAQEWQRCQGEASAAQSADSRNSAALTTAVSQLKEAEIKWAEQVAKRPQLEQIRQKQVALEGLLPRVAALKIAEVSYEKCRAELAENRQQIAELEAKWQQLEPQFSQDEAALKKQQVAVQLLPVEETKLKEQARLLWLKKGLETAQLALISAQQKQAQCVAALKAQQAEADEAKQQHQTVALAWHSGQAALLAKALKEGLPCPVCGSEAHPAPAETGEALPTEAQVSEALEHSDYCTEKVSKLQAQQQLSVRDCEQVAQKIEEQWSELGEAASLELGALERQLAEMSQKVNNLLKSRQQLASKEQALSRLEAALLQHKRLISAAEAEGLVLAKREVAAQQDLDNKLAELPEAQRIAGNIERDIKQAEKAGVALSQQIEMADQNHRLSREQLTHAEAQSTLSKAHAAQQQQVSDQAEQRWLKALLESDFEDQAVFKIARRSTDELVKLEQRIKRYSQQKLAAETTVNERAQRVEGQQPVELETLKNREQAAANVLKQIASEYHQKKARQKQLQAAQERLTDTSKQLASLSERYKIVGRLSRVANGENSHNLSLQRFVLSVLLDDVLIAATQRLLMMSKGRYQLIRKTEVTHGARKAGLDLDVADQYTGKTRSVATLSGGESFIAALSLALGLSDVVQSYSGGIQLDMLFIDEGFGSLDSDSLELAIRTLVDLQAVGRMVGVISHVSELKERMAARIDLVACASGSAIKLVTPSLNM